jgi:phosphoribosylformylglycinamidine cyclo-ligase
MADGQRSGLDIDLKGRCSAIACAHSRTTFAARAGKSGALVEGLEASFASVVQFGALKLGITSDGIGTKIELAERVGDYSTLGWDLTAMVADDLAANGIEPTHLTNILDVDRLDERVVDELLKGLARATSESGIAIAGGEIAELGSRIGGWGPGMHFNWCATAVGLLPAGVAPVDGSSITAGDAVVSIKERGFRSNGFSLVRKVMAEAFGERWHEASYDRARRWGEVLLTPSRVCAPLVVKVLGAGIALKGIANITGGGIPDKLGRVLRARQVGATLDSLFEPLEPMRALQEAGRVDDAHAYRMWNMGNAMLLVLAPADVERVVQIAGQAGFEAQRAGTISAEPVIRIRGAPATIEFPTPPAKR